MSKKQIIVFFISLILFGLSLTYLNLKLPARKLHNENVGSLLLGTYRSYLASIFWNRIDMYHHFWEFSGRSPTTENGSLYLVKLSVSIDPHMVRAWSLGSFMLYKFNHKKEVGLKFLKEGIIHNPQSFYLWKDLAFYYLFIEKDKNKAYHTGLRALKYIKKPDYKDIQYYIFLRAMIELSFEHENYKLTEKLLNILRSENKLVPFVNKMEDNLKEVYNEKSTIQ